MTETGAPLDGYLATPGGSGPWPGVVVLHEAFGLDDVMRRHADRLADAGYLAFAPDLFGHGGPRKCLVSTLRQLRNGTGQAFTDIDTARDWLTADGRCTGAVGVIGFCMGGGFAIATAATGFDAASVNYGVLPKDIDAALVGACPVVASYGGRDNSLRGKAVTLEKALSKAGVSHDVKEYAKAGHSFLNDAPVGPRALRPLLSLITHFGPEPDSAADAWRRIETFFATYLTAAEGVGA